MVSRSSEMSLLNNLVNAREGVKCKPLSSLSSFEDIAAEFLLTYPEESAYFLDSTHLREKVGVFLSQFMPEDSNAVTAYAIKANPNEQVLRILTDEGIKYFDCASPSEIKTISSIDNNAIGLYNNPLKRRQDIVLAANMGVKHFTVQTHSEIQKVFQETHGIIDPKDLEIAVRLQTLNDAAAINLSTKFGATTHDVLGMFKHIRTLGIVPGISIHTGSQNSDPQTFHDGVEKIMNIVKKEGKINTLNIGGGIPVNYLGGKSYNITDYLNIINKSLREVVNEIFDNDNYKLIIEPGRSMIGDSVKLVIPILSREKRGQMDSIYINDGIFGSFNPADTPNVEATFKVLRKDGDKIIELPMQNARKFEVFGCSCDSADKLPNKMLPVDVREGDWILHETAGAYTSACRSDFNGYAEHSWVIY